jgi:hypothetical protein
MRNLPGLKPTLRLLARGATNARAIRGHVIPRFSAFFRGQKKTHTRSQNNLFCLHRSQHSRLRFQRPLKPSQLRFLFRVFRVFRGERWFPVANTVIEQAHLQLARAKAHATVSGPGWHECPRKTRSRHSAFFRVLQRPKKTHTQNNLPCPPRSQHSCLQFQPPRTPLLLRFLFRVLRVFRGERWFPVANIVIEQAHAQLARAKAHATVAGAQNKVTSFRVFPRFSAAKKSSTRNPVPSCRLHCQSC